MGKPGHREVLNRDFIYSRPILDFPIAQTNHNHSGLPTLSPKGPFSQEPCNRLHQLSEALVREGCDWQSVPEWVGLRWEDSKPPLDSGSPPGTAFIIQLFVYSQNTLETQCTDGGDFGWLITMDFSRFTPGLQRTPSIGLIVTLLKSRVGDMCLTL